MKKRGNFDGDDVTEGDNACRSADLLLKEIGRCAGGSSKKNCWSC